MNHLNYDDVNPMTSQRGADNLFTDDETVLRDGEMIPEGSLVEATDGPVGQVRQLVASADQPDMIGALLVRTNDGQMLGIPVTAIDEVLPGQPGAVVRLRMSRAELTSPAIVLDESVTDAPANVTATTAANAPLTDEAQTVAGEDIRVPLAEERLIASKQWGERGRVRISKRVERQDQNMVVPLTYEEVTVEHLSPDHFDANAPRDPDELIIPIVEERLVIRKETVVKEYLRVRKQSRVKQYRVRGQVRREVIQVQEAPNPAYAGEALPLARERTYGQPTEQVNADTH